MIRAKRLFDQVEHETFVLDPSQVLLLESGQDGMGKIRKPAFAKSHGSQRCKIMEIIRA